MDTIRRAGTLLAALLLAACATRTETRQQDATPQLEGTSWQLVEFQGGDGATLTPDDQHGMHDSIRCQRPGHRAHRLQPRARHVEVIRTDQIEFGPLALTRAMCPPGSLHDQIVRQWGYIRSCVLKDGHLFLALMADGGIYEFEPTK